VREKREGEGRFEVKRDEFMQNRHKGEKGV
jgi:hypothetical protein